MSMNTYHLAQVNIGRPRAPLDSEVMADFMAALEPINALADRSPGFVWRLQTEDGDATSLRAFDDDRIMINISVWQSLESLAEYVYRGDHTAIMRQRRRWFEHMTVYMALWWIPAGHIPTLREAEERLQLLESRGPTADAFTFPAPFAPPNAAQTAAARADDLCPV